MLKKISTGLFFPLVMLFANHSLNSHIGEHVGWRSMYSLSKYEIDNRFQEVQKQVKMRWNLLLKDYEFPYYMLNKEESDIVSEFYQLSNLRVRLWFEDCGDFPCQSNQLFKVSQELLLKKRFRQPSCVTFEHAITDFSYNSTCIQVGKRRFLALEGPTEEHVSYFFRLLLNWKVAYLVCLTDEKDAQMHPKCFPYWKDKMIEENQECFLRLPLEGEYEKSSSWGEVVVPYEFWNDWEDHHGVNPQKLIEVVNRVRQNINDNEIIAVHCSAGVGRTGTFISAICLLDTIDQQLKRGILPGDIQLSIARLFLYLNFHRPWLVAKPSQYVTLYKMVKCYIDHLEKNLNKPL